MSCQSGLQKFEIKSNDTYPAIKGRLVEKDPDNPGQEVAVDLTGASVKFIMITDDNDRTIKVNSAGTITDEANGEFEYEWQVGDTDTAGNYLGEFEITLSTGKKLSVPADDTLKIVIRLDYDGA